MSYRSRCNPLGLWITGDYRLIERNLPAGVLCWVLYKAFLRFLKSLKHFSCNFYEKVRHLLETIWLVGSSRWYICPYWKYTSLPLEMAAGFLVSLGRSFYFVFHPGRDSTSTSTNHKLEVEAHQGYCSCLSEFSLKWIFCVSFSFERSGRKVIFLLENVAHG